MRNPMKLGFMVIFLGCLLVAQGCGILGSGTRETTRFFVLKSLSEAPICAAPRGESGPISLGIGPVKLPDTLNRSQMVTRLSENEVRLEPFYRWAEPLAENISSVLAGNLSVLLNTNRVLTFPWAVASRPDYQVRLTVVDFIGTPGGEANLEVRWALTRGEEKKELVNKHSMFKAPVSSSGHGDLVSVQCRLLMDFSREVAQAVCNIGKD